MEGIVGEIRLMTQTKLKPKEWMLCNGALLPIIGNQVLYSVIGTKYGGDGIHNFRLPNFQARSAMGTADPSENGLVSGSSTTPLNPNQLPAHHHGVLATKQYTIQEFTLGSAFIAAGSEGHTDSPNNAIPAPYENANVFSPTKDDDVTMAPNQFDASSLSYSSENMGVLIEYTGNSQAHMEIQDPATVLQYWICVEGIYPPISGGVAGRLLGEIMLFAGHRIPEEWYYCDGRELPIADTTALFAVIRDSYGGNDSTSFRLPDLRQRIPVGAGAWQNTGIKYTLGQQFGHKQAYLDAAQMWNHHHKADFSGAVKFAAQDVYFGDGLAANDGPGTDTVPSAGYAGKLQTNAGDDFAEPSQSVGYLGAATAKASGSTNINTTAQIEVTGDSQPVPLESPTLTVSMVMPNDGDFPSRTTNYMDFTGVVRPWAGYYVPKNWHICDGTLLLVKDYPELFSLIGNTFGGSALKDQNFAIPDLRGCSPLGLSTDTKLGDKLGAETWTMTAASLPYHTHGTTGAVATLDEFNLAGEFTLPASKANGTKKAAIDNYYAANAFKPYANSPGQACFMASANNTISTNEFSIPVAQDGNTSDAGQEDPGEVYTRMPSLAINFMICLNGIFPVSSEEENTSEHAQS